MATTGISKYSQMIIFHQWNEQILVEIRVILFANFFNRRSWHPAGISRLVEEGIYSAAYPLHEVRTISLLWSGEVWRHHVTNLLPCMPTE